MDALADPAALDVAEQHEEDRTGDQDDGRAERGPRPRAPGRSPSGSSTMHIASAIAICGSRSTRSGPSSASEPTIGRTSAADDDAISTA